MPARVVSSGTSPSRGSARHPIAPHRHHTTTSFSTTSSIPTVYTSASKPRHTDVMQVNMTFPGAESRYQRMNLGVSEHDENYNATITTSPRRRVSFSGTPRRADGGGEADPTYLQGTYSSSRKSQLQHEKFQRLRRGEVEDDDNLYGTTNSTTASITTPVHVQDIDSSYHLHHSEERHTQQGTTHQQYSYGEAVPTTADTYSRIHASYHPPSSLKSIHQGVMSGSAWGVQDESHAMDDLGISPLQRLAEEEEAYGIDNHHTSTPATTEGGPEVITLTSRSIHNDYRNADQNQRSSAALATPTTTTAAVNYSLTPTPHQPHTTASPSSSPNNNIIRTNTNSGTMGEYGALIVRAYRQERIFEICSEEMVSRQWIRDEEHEARVESIRMVSEGRLTGVLSVLQTTLEHQVNRYASEESSRGTYLGESGVRSHTGFGLLPLHVQNHIQCLEHSLHLKDEKIAALQRKLDAALTSSQVKQTTTSVYEDAARTDEIERLLRLCEDFALTVDDQQQKIAHLEETCQSKLAPLVAECIQSLLPFPVGHALVDESISLLTRASNDAIALQRDLSMLLPMTDTYSNNNSDENGVSVPRRSSPTSNTTSPTRRRRGCATCSGSPKEVDLTDDDQPPSMEYKAPSNPSPPARRSSELRHVAGGIFQRVCSAIHCLHDLNDGRVLIYNKPTEVLPILTALKQMNGLLLQLQVLDDVAANVPGAHEASRLLATLDEYSSPRTVPTPPPSGGATGSRWMASY